MSFRARSVLSLLLLTPLGGCATASSLSGVNEPDFAVVVERYQGLGGSKFLALATEANGRFAWGIASDEASEADARSAALERCGRAAKSGGLRAECHAFAVGDAPAPETVEGCMERRLSSKRCQMQRTHQRKL